jgi:branched-subunit amino acid aminotransferase/4-amino-4-deoxychorismate lyase
VTRDKILEAARATGLEVREEPVAKETLLAANEAFLTSTTAEIIPVVAVDDRKIGSGKPGPVTARVYDQFARMFTQK